MGCSLSYAAGIIMPTSSDDNDILFKEMTIVSEAEHLYGISTTVE